ncbi:MAG: hypothetical protein ABIL09_10460 [Gemmatimonadota bacterium]
MELICPLPGRPARLFEGGGDADMALEAEGECWLLREGGRVLAPSASADPPEAAVVDTCGNGWRLWPPGSGATPQVRPAGGPSQWLPIPAGPGPWAHLVADAAGFIWIGGEDGLRRLDPHHPEAGWRALAPAPDLPGSPVTALARSADDLALAGFASGELVAVDVDAGGAPLVQVLGRLPGAVCAVCTDGRGQVWAATDRALYRRPAAPGAWQHAWRALPRLPGGNHDLFALELEGRAWMAGGLTSGWGWPARTHVFDELLAYDPAAARWEVVSHLPFPRCYSGIAWLAGRLWIVGGAANRRDPGNPDGQREPLGDVRTYDPAAGAWSPAPSLNQPRLEPIVLTAAGRIWAIGGSCGGPLTAVESIGLGEDRWRPEPPLPMPLSQADGCVLDGLLYCIGRPGLLAFDPGQGRWLQDLPQLPEPPQAPQVAAHRGRIWVMGGSRRRSTHLYDPRQRTWCDGPELPTDQAWGAALELGGRLLVAGGAHWSEVHRTYVFDDRVFELRER